MSGQSDPFVTSNGVASAFTAFADFDGDNDRDAFAGSIGGTIRYLRNDNGRFHEVIGPFNPFHGVDLGWNATLTFFQFDALRALVGHGDGTITEYKRIGDKLSISVMLCHSFR